MSMPFSFPDWVPWWVPIVLLVPALLYALAFLFMPFSVLGVKSRLEAIEARLYEIHQEMRILAGEIPGARHEMDFEDVYGPVAQPGRQEPQLSDRPPIPPTVQEYGYDDGPIERPAPPPHARPAHRQEPAPPRSPRTEPRLDRH